LNSAKGGGYNVDREYLHDNLTMLFEQHDLKQLQANWSQEGFPIVYLPANAHVKAQALSDRYVDLILAEEGKFEVDENELL
jgi:glutathione peroxidase-family protein